VVRLPWNYLSLLPPIFCLAAFALPKPSSILLLLAVLALLGLAGLGAAIVSLVRRERRMWLGVAGFVANLLLLALLASALVYPGAMGA
jgi:hypothetical protein